MGGIFVFGLCAGVFLTLLAASSVPDRDTHEDNRPQDMRKRSQNLLQASVSVAPALLRPDGGEDAEGQGDGQSRRRQHR